MTPLEHKQLKAQATKDVLFEEASGFNQPKLEKKQKKRPKSGQNEADLEKDDEDRVKIESLNHKASPLPVPHA